MANLGSCPRKTRVWFFWAKTWWRARKMMHFGNNCWQFGVPGTDLQLFGFLYRAIPVCVESHTRRHFTLYSTPCTKKNLCLSSVSLNSRELSTPALAQHSASWSFLCFSPLKSVLVVLQDWWSPVVLWIEVAVKVQGELGWHTSKANMLTACLLLRFCLWHTWLPDRAVKMAWITLIPTSVAFLPVDPVYLSLDVLKPAVC